MPIFMNKTDAYLSQAFEDAAAWENESLEGHKGVSEDAEVSVAMLIRVRTPLTWSPPAGFTIQSELGNVISGRGTHEALAALKQDSEVLSIEASRPAGTEETINSVPFVRGNRVHTALNAEKGDQALVAIIDGGIDILHEAFLDDNGSSRIVEIWDQRDSTGPAPNVVRPELMASYGTVHTSAQISQYIAKQSLPTPLQHQPVSGYKHGTHVTSIAAGRPVGTFGGGMAPSAKIVIVISKLDTDPSDPRSIGYSASHVDALAYIRAVADDQSLPVVVNVSQGMNAGAHDGSSLLEAAFDEFSGGGRDPGAAIVKSSGNERGFNGHARLTVAGNTLDELTWHSEVAYPPSMYRTDLFELWFKASDEFKFRVKDPLGNWSNQVTWTNPSVTQTLATGNKVSMSYTRYHHDNGDSRLLVTIRPGSAPDVKAGDWTLEIISGQIQSRGEINAWVERRGARLVRFTNHLEEETTLSIPGTARTVITVGAVSSSFPVRMASFSSFGPTRDRREQPDVVAPGVDIEAADADTKVKTRGESGTSMAAPHVTGAIALLFSYMAKQPNAIVPNAAQVRAALTQNAQNFSGHFTPSNGYGVFDAEALLRAFQ